MFRAFRAVRRFLRTARAPGCPTPAKSALSSRGILVVANQKRAHRAPRRPPKPARETRQNFPSASTVHEVAVSPDARFAYVPIYGNSGVGKAPAPMAQTIDIVDLQQRKLAASIELGKPFATAPNLPSDPTACLLRQRRTRQRPSLSSIPHRVKSSPKLPPASPKSHMFRAKQRRPSAPTPQNVHVGTVSVIDIANRKLITTIPVAKQGPAHLHLSRRRSHLHPRSRAPPRHRRNRHRHQQKSATGSTSPIYAYASEPHPRTAAFYSPCSPRANKTIAIDLQTLKVTKSFDVPQLPGEILIRPDAARRLHHLHARWQKSAVPRSEILATPTIDRP